MKILVIGGSGLIGSKRVKKLRERDDPREVVADWDARYFGAELGELTLVPGDDARLGQTRFDDWVGGTPTTTVNQVTRGIPKAVAIAAANS